MKTMNRKLLAGALVVGLGAAGIGVTAMAQPYWHGGYGPGHMGGGPCWGYDGGASASSWRDVAQQRTAYLHDSLKLNETQEKAWKNYQSTISANIKAAQENELIDFSGMTAPQRMEKSRQLMKERDERLDNQLQALKAFYSSLSPEQQQIFDAEGAGYGGYGWRGGRGGPRGGYGSRGHRGPHY